MKFGKAGDGRTEVEQTKVIPDSHGVKDTETDYRNLMWTPPRNHGEKYATAVLNRIRSEDANLGGRKNEQAMWDTRKN